MLFSHTRANFFMFFFAKTFSHWDGYLGMMTAMTQVPIPMTSIALRSLRSSFRPPFAFFLYEMNNNWKSFCIFVPIISKRNEYEIH